MISLILYGRNDTHGYNLHRRAALSLNCLAEVLTDPDDEIVFVDYNTPDELPTFIEAIADTLTDRCLDRLRVIRVPAALHRERYSGLTHLPALEPVCRNAAARRANPANKWLLSTNTDMILLPFGEAGLSDVCRDLADGFYGLPRFEVPEWLWERWPRSDPRRVMSELETLGPRLRLDEVTLHEGWVRFDAPGDFQLCLQKDFVAIDGFDETMLLGWHVDSNFWRRMGIHRGAEDRLDDRVAGYHCNHSRIPTVYGSDAVGNDLTQFYWGVDRAALPAQRRTWGLADAVLQEVALRPRIGGRFARTVAASIPDTSSPRLTSDTSATHGELTYDSGHVLPHVADSIAVSPPGVVIGYLGANTVLEHMLARVVGELDGDVSFRSLTAPGESLTNDAAESIDLFVVDLGLDVASSSSLDHLEHGDGSTRARVPHNLRRACAAFEKIVDLERGRLERGLHPRRFVLVNSANAYFDSFVRSNLDCSHTSAHSRVRRATVKATPASRVRALRELSWGDGLTSPGDPCIVAVGARVEIADLWSLAGFGRGWAGPDPDAIWTRGERAELVLAASDSRSSRSRRRHLELTFARVGVRSGARLHVRLLIDDAPVASRTFLGGAGLRRWRVRIPPSALSAPTFGVALELDGDGAWGDDRRLGLQLRSLGIERSVLPPRLGEARDRVRERLARIARRYSR